MHQVQINIVHVKGLEGGVDTVFDAVVPGVVQLGRDPYLIPRDARIFDALADLVLIAIRQCGINVAIACIKRCFDCYTDLIRWRLPCAQTYSRYLIALLFIRWQA